MVSFFFYFPLFDWMWDVGIWGEEDIKLTDDTLGFITSATAKRDSERGYWVIMLW